jgi:hypothetical protein
MITITVEWQTQQANKNKTLGYGDDDACNYVMMVV